MFSQSIVRVLSLKVIEMFRSMFLTLITNAIYFCEALMVIFNENIVQYIQSHDLRYSGLFLSYPRVDPSTRENIYAEAEPQEGGVGARLGPHRGKSARYVFSLFVLNVGYISQHVEHNNLFVPCPNRFGGMHIQNRYVFLSVILNNGQLSILR